MRGDEELIPLRGVKDEIVGSDIRYPFYARAAGYQLYGDPDVRPQHMVSYPLTCDDYAGQSIASQTAMRVSLKEVVSTSRARIQSELAGLK